jgi:molybdopterin synthase catalytic subunit
MIVHVRLFAIQRELAGTRDVDVRIAAGARVDDAWQALVAAYPVLAPGRASVRFARNGSYVEPDERLEDGDELAVIPPVSGGADVVGAGGRPEGRTNDADDARTIVELTPEPFARSILADLADRLATPADGAVVGFLGRTRETPGTPAPGQEDEAATHAGERVDGLEYEALEPMALAILREIAAEARDRFGVHRLAIVHRTGAVPLGEPSVAIVAVAPHRAAAFAAARYAIDETKGRAPIWKAERFASGHVWVGAPARSGPTEDHRG